MLSARSVGDRGGKWSSACGSAARSTAQHSKYVPPDASDSTLTVCTSSSPRRVTNRCLASEDDEEDEEEFTSMGVAAVGLLAAASERQLWKPRRV